MSADGRPLLCDYGINSVLLASCSPSQNLEPGAIPNDGLGQAMPAETGLSGHDNSGLESYSWPILSSPIPRSSIRTSDISDSALNHDAGLKNPFLDSVRENSSSSYAMAMGRSPSPVHSLERLLDTLPRSPVLQLETGRDSPDSRYSSLSPSLGNSARWMAVEMFNCDFSNANIPESHTMKTDVWAFGMTVYVSRSLLIVVNHLRVH